MIIFKMFICLHIILLNHHLQPQSFVHEIKTYLTVYDKRVNI